LRDGGGGYRSEQVGGGVTKSRPREKEKRQKCNLAFAPKAKVATKEFKEKGNHRKEDNS